MTGFARIDDRFARFGRPDISSMPCKVVHFFWGQGKVGYCAEKQFVIFLNHEFFPLSFYSRFCIFIH